MPGAEWVDKPEPGARRSLTLFILEADYRRIVDAAMAAKLTPETYAQRIFYAGLEGVRRGIIAVEYTSDGIAQPPQPPALTRPPPSNKLPQPPLDPHNNRVGRGRKAAALTPAATLEIENERRQFVSASAHVRWLLATRGDELLQKDIAARAGVRPNFVSTVKSQEWARRHNRTLREREKS